MKIVHLWNMAEYECGKWRSMYNVMLARSHRMPTKVTMVEAVNPIANSIITLRSDPKAITAMK